MRMRLNLEITGIAALGLALILGVALVAPAHSGAFGAAIARGLDAAFGGAAWLVPVVVAIFGGIVFLEIDVPRTIATLGFASLCYFFIIDAVLGRAGGDFGNLLERGLRVLVGAAGSRIVLVLCALAVTVWIFNLSVKRIIGALLLAAVRVQTAVRKALEARAARPAASGPLVKAPPGPASWREAFHLPPTFLFWPRPPEAQPQSDETQPAAPASVMPSRVTPSYVVPSLLLPPIAPVDARTFMAQEERRESRGFALADEAAIETLAYAEPAAKAPPPGADAMAQPATGAPGEPARRIYALPNLDLFDPPQAQIADDSHRSLLLEDTLASFGVGAKVTHVQRGPSITRYELRPEKGVKISRITALADDLALALAATSVRIEAPIPGKSAVGIEVPNAQTSIVSIREILEALPQRGTVPPLHMALGKDITGRPVFGDLGKMPHLLVAGATGSGKSVCLNTIIASLLVSATPDQVQMLFIDPKRVELTVYNGIPHLIKDVITDARLAAGALFEMTKEMDGRYERFAKAGVRKIEEYNAKYPAERLPYVVIVIDELADLMLIAPAKVETTICRLAQLARATGIHLVVATQRPSVDVITGIIKANIPSRIAFAVSSQVDSRTILDMVGAERLLGRGDMLFLPIDAPKPVRSQGALITGPEVTRLVEFWATQARPENLLDVEVTPIEDDDKRRDTDPLCYEAAVFIIQSDFASTAQLQQRFSIGHPRAVRVMKQLEDFGVVGPHEGTKPRRINIGLGELETIADRLGKPDQLDLDLTPT